MTETQGFDPDAYLRRIGWEGERRADLATLRGVHLAHTRAIPFENLDALRRIAPSLDPADLTAKLLHGRCGGYCYEHNTLFAGVLEALGFRVTRLAARVVVGTDRIESRPRTHMTLLVEAPGDPQPYLADVGFGAIGALLEPVPLTAGVEFEDAGRRHRLAHAPHGGPLPLWLLQAHDRTKDEWADQYAFTLEPFEKPDFDVINWQHRHQPALTLHPARLRPEPVPRAPPAAQRPAPRRDAGGRNGRRARGDGRGGGAAAAGRGVRDRRPRRDDAAAARVRTGRQSHQKCQTGRPSRRFSA